MAKSIVRRTFLLSMGFGLLMGIVFPFYAMIFTEFKSSVMMVFFIIGCLIAGLIVGTVSFLITRFSLIKPLNRVGEGLASFIDDKKDLDIESLRVDSNDSLGDLVEGFIQAICRLQDFNSVINSSFVNSQSLSKEIEMSIKRTLAVVDVFTRTALLMDTAATDQDSYVAAMDKEFKDLSKAVVLNVSNLIELYSNIREFGDVLMNQTDSLESILIGLEDVQKKVGDENYSQQNWKESLSSITASLSQKAVNSVTANQDIFSRVEQSIKEIENISDRTNILSINASIEAARFGSEGAGFRVIAGNIKQLSQEVQLLTNSLTEVLSQARSEMDDVNTSLNSTMEVHSRKVQEVRESVNGLAARNITIKETASELHKNRDLMEDLLKAIRNNMEQLRHILEENRRSLDQIVDTSFVIHSGTETLLNKAQVIQKSEVGTGKALKIYIDHLSRNFENETDMEYFSQRPVSEEDIEELDELEEL